MTERLKRIAVGLTVIAIFVWLVTSEWILPIVTLVATVGAAWVIGDLVLYAWDTRKKS